MGRNRFVTPETAQLALSDGDWIEVKRKLTYGERRALEQAGIRRSFRSDELGAGAAAMQIDVDAVEVDVATILAWVVDWSFVDASGKPVPFGREAVRALDPDSAEEVLIAIRAHVEGEQGKATPTPSVPSENGTGSAVKSRSAVT